jgi:hypothetical protein
VTSNSMSAGCNALPRLLILCTSGCMHAPWEHAPFKFLARSHRAPQAHDVFHPSVIQRWKSDGTYRPGALAFVTPQLLDQLTVDNVGG